MEIIYVYILIVLLGVISIIIIFFWKYNSNNHKFEQIKDLQLSNTVIPNNDDPNSLKSIDLSLNKDNIDDIASLDNRVGVNEFKSELNTPKEFSEEDDTNETDETNCSPIIYFNLMYNQFNSQLNLTLIKVLKLPKPSDGGRKFIRICVDLLPNMKIRNYTSWRRYDRALFNKTYHYDNIKYEQIETTLIRIRIFGAIFKLINKQTLLVELLIPLRDIDDIDRIFGDDIIKCQVQMYKSSVFPCSY